MSIKIIIISDSKANLIIIEMNLIFFRFAFQTLITVDYRQVALSGQEFAMDRLSTIIIIKTIVIPSVVYAGNAVPGSHPFDVVALFFYNVALYHLARPILHHHSHRPMR